MGDKMGKMDTEEMMKLVGVFDGLVNHVLAVYVLLAVGVSLAMPLCGCVAGCVCVSLAS